MKTVMGWLAGLRSAVVIADQWSTQHCGSDDSISPILANTDASLRAIAATELSSCTSPDHVSQIVLIGGGEG